MTSLRLTKTSLWIAVLSVGAWLPAPAHAEETCSFHGDAVMPKTVSVYDAPSGGAEIAHFTGGNVTLTVTSFPDSPGGRAAVETGGFRIKGFVRAREIPVYTVRSVPVYAGHVWIADGRKVSVIGTAPGKLGVEKTLTWPMSGLFQAFAPCDALSLSEKVPSGWTPPGGARGYRVKPDHIDLYGAPRGEVVTGFDKATDSPDVLLWGSERENGYVHVELHGEVTIDAWAHARDLVALPPGETMDQLAPSRSVGGAPKLSVQGQPRIVKPQAPVLLRNAASDAAGVLGGIDAGVEVIVLDVVAGWASVVPKTLSIAPAGEKQFWAKAKDLGL
ncbi:MAG TPA: hypothetical protein VHE30_19190 [Polyangiaceae bacterium]|nr:hypothetical protein [Polyangiaceae bacterium]